MISTLSMFSVVTLAKSKARFGEMGSFASTPSMRTRVCSEFAPLMNTDVCCPGPPRRTTSRPGTALIASWRNCFPDSSSSAPEITVTELPTWATGVSSRVAVTTISSTSSCV